jgi:hypothetical protein
MGRRRPPRRIRLTSSIRESGVAASPQPSSSELITHIIRKRVADLRAAANKALARALVADPKLRAAYGILESRVRRFGTSTVFEYPPEVLTRTKSRGYLYPEAVALLNARDIINHHLIPRVVEILPSMTRTHLFTLLKDAWPGSRGSKRLLMFDPYVTAQAHDALRREQPDWGCRGACEVLAQRLAIDVRTVKSLIKRGDRKNR